MWGGDFMLETPPEVYIRYYQNQRGGGGGQQMHIYRGPKYQRGYGIGSIFRSVIKTLTPIFTSQKFKDAAATAGRHALSAGVNIGKDLVEGANLKEALKRRGKEALAEAYHEVVDTMGSEGGQSGEGIKRRRLVLKNLAAILGKRGVKKRGAKKKRSSKKRGGKTARKRKSRKGSKKNKKQKKSKGRKASKTSKKRRRRKKGKKTKNRRKKTSGTKRSLFGSGMSNRYFFN